VQVFGIGLALRFAVHTEPAIDNPVNSAVLDFGSRLPLINVPDISKITHYDTFKEKPHSRSQ
jgi:hypothetical protein